MSVRGLFADSMVRVDHQRLLVRCEISSSSKWWLKLERNIPLLQTFAKKSKGGRGGMLILEGGIISRMSMVYVIGLIVLVKPCMTLQA